MEPGPHVEEMEAAIRADGEGLRALLDGDEAAAANGSPTPSRTTAPHGSSRRRAASGG